MRFAMLYSCGKDSALALGRMVAEGHEPVCLITTYNREAGRSWFHGITEELLDAVSASLGIQLLTCVCTSDSYERKIEAALEQARLTGAEAAVFGDIDIQKHLDWNEERCKSIGLECIVPLWQEQRKRLVSEVVAKGYKAVIKCVDLACLDASYLGETLDEGVVRRIEQDGVDACGENGEYHTFVYDGPIFSRPVPIKQGESHCSDTHAFIDITLNQT